MRLERAPVAVGLAVLIILGNPASADTITFADHVILEDEKCMLSFVLVLS